MTSRLLVFAGCAMLVAQRLPAQAVAAVNDPISGMWTGEIGQSATDRHAVTMNLRFDGKTIAGTVSQPSAATVRAGSFDPKTGALRLEIDVPQDGAAPRRFVFDGTVVWTTATGRVTANQETGNFVMTRRAATETPSTVSTDAAAAGSVRAANREMAQAFGELSAWVQRAAEAVPAERYAYKPVETVRTFGQQVAHLIDSYEFYCARAAGREVQWSDATEQGRTDKATLGPRLRQATAMCTGIYGGTAPPGQLLANIGHTALHYGNIVTYMRMMGLVPPSS